MCNSSDTIIYNNVNKMLSVLFAENIGLSVTIYLRLLSFLKLSVFLVKTYIVLLI